MHDIGKFPYSFMSVTKFSGYIYDYENIIGNDHFPTSIFIQHGSADTMVKLGGCCGESKATTCCCDIGKHSPDDCVR